MGLSLGLIFGFILLGAYEYRHRLFVNEQLKKAQAALQQAQEEKQNLHAQLDELHRIQEEAFNQTVDGILTWHSFEDGMRQAILESTRHQLHFGVLLVSVAEYNMLSKFLDAEQIKRLWRQIGVRLKSMIREEDRMGQFSESVFAMMLRYVQRKEAVAMVAKRFIDSFNDPISIDGLSIQIKLKIGIALFPEDGLEVAGLICGAESALQSIEKSAQSQYEFCQAELNFKHELEIKAYEALMKNNFFETCRIKWQFYRNATTEGLYIFSLSAMGASKMSQGHLFRFLDQYGKMEACLGILLEDLPDDLRSNKQLLVALPLLASQAENVHFIYRLPELIQKHGLEMSQCLWLLQGLPKTTNRQELSKGLNRLTYLGSQIGLDAFGKSGLDLSIFRESKINFLRLSSSFLSDVSSSPQTKKLLTHLIYFANDMGVSFIAPPKMDQVAKQTLQAMEANFFLPQMSSEHSI